MGDRRGKTRERLDGFSWSTWAERAVVRALEIPQAETIEGALLHGQSTSIIAFTIARAVGYLAGTQRSPEMPEALRAWLDGVTTDDKPHEGERLGGLSWGAWAQRASGLAMEIGAERVIEGGLLAGQPLWKVAVTIARAIAYLAGVERAPELAAGLHTWLQGSPRLPGSVPVEEHAR